MTEILLHKKNESVRSVGSLFKNAASCVTILLEKLQATSHFFDHTHFKRHKILHELDFNHVFCMSMEEHGIGGRLFMSGNV